MGRTAQIPASRRIELSRKLLEPVGDLPVSQSSEQLNSTFALLDLPVRTPAA